MFLRFSRPNLKKIGSIFIACLFLVVGLAACNDEKPRTLIDEHAAEAQKALSEMTQYKPEKKYNPLVVTDKIWAGSSATRMHRGLPLPLKFESERGVTLISSDPLSLADIVNAIHVQSGIPVRISDTGAANNNSSSATTKNSNDADRLRRLAVRIA
jgi:hypothetical protein